MVILRTDAGNLDIKDIVGDRSTYIRGARSFSISMYGKNEVDLTQIDIKLISNYLNYLTYQSFEMRDDDKEFFSFMGQHTDYYDCRSWKAILVADIISEDILANIDLVL